MKSRTPVIEKRVFKALIHIGYYRTSTQLPIQDVTLLNQITEMIDLSMTYSIFHLTNGIKDRLVCLPSDSNKQGFQVLLHDGKHNNLFTRYSEHATEYQATSHHIDFEHVLCSWLLCWSM